LSHGEHDETGLAREHRGNGSADPGREAHRPPGVSHFGLWQDASRLHRGARELSRPWPAGMS
jgi:hypothetical protein